VWTVTPEGPPVLRPPLTPVIPGRTNVVVMIGCTFRSDQVGAYGGPRGATPFLDEMAAEGTRFSATIAQAPWTKAGTTSIVTGDYALVLGVNHPGVGADDQRVPEVATTLAERFKAAGYATIGGTANPNANALFGFSQGFDSYYEASGLWRDEEVKVPGDRVVDEVLSHVPADGPFYAQVLLVDAHGPYTAGKAWYAWAPFSSGRVAQYRAQLHRLDAAFEHLVDGLAAQGHSIDDTVFVAIGDHGEGLYTPEHHGKAHGFYLYPSAVHVPWLMRGPGVARGHVIDGVRADRPVADPRRARRARADRRVARARSVGAARRIRGDHRRDPCVHRHLVPQRESRGDLHARADVPARLRSRRVVRAREEGEQAPVGRTAISDCVLRLARRSRCDRTDR
jgi:arylsulfatase A-like enzyme